MPRLKAAPRAALVMTICLAGPSAEGQTLWKGGVTQVDTVPAPALRNNLIGDPYWREATIYLPPSYRTSRKRYPVVYLLHGFAADHRAFVRGAYQNLNVRITMDSLIAAGAVREMIVVTPNARNFFDGSFYANSPVSGNWEDFIVRDLIGHLDRNYRTIRSRSGRAIAGHSMGGYGALRIAMLHPDKFSAVYAFSPCCLASMNAPERMAAWRSAVRLKERSDYTTAGFTANLLYAIASVYSPNVSRPPFFADLPWRLEGDSLVEVPEVASLWQKGPLAMAASNIASLRKLAIAFDAGDRDALTDIPVNVRALDSLLTANDVPHVAEIYPDTHGNRVRERLASKILPFLSRQLR